MSLIQVENVSFNAGQFKIVKDINLTIEKGTISAFLGNPGSGKSTMLKLSAGILHPEKGRVLFEDTDIAKMTRKQDLAFRKKAAFMFQDSALWENQDIYNNLDIPLRIHYPKMPPAERKEWIASHAAATGYTKSLNIRPAALSIGERKRIGMARALICQPELLFLDEPTESLDEKTSELFKTIIREFMAEGRTVVFVSHDDDFISSFKCDKYYFDEGNLIEKGN